MNCVVCDKPLTGGIDTFGPIDAPLCQTHFFEDPEPTRLTGTASAAIAFLRAEINRCEMEIYDKRIDLEDIEGEIGTLEAERDKYEVELKRLETPQPQKVSGPYLLWQQAG